MKTIASITGLLAIFALQLDAQPFQRTDILTGYHTVTRITVSTESGVASIPSGTELEEIQRLPDGRLRTNFRGVEFVFTENEISNDEEAVKAAKLEQAQADQNLKNSLTARRAQIAEWEKRKQENLQNSGGSDVTTTRLGNAPRNSERENPTSSEINERYRRERVKKDYDARIRALQQELSALEKLSPGYTDTIGKNGSKPANYATVRKRAILQEIQALKKEQAAAVNQEQPIIRVIGAPKTQE